MNSILRRSFPLAAAVAVALAVSACGNVNPSNLSATGSAGVPKHAAPVPDDLKRAMARKGMDPRAPILVRIYKEQRQLEVWKKTRAGKYALLKTYDICAYSGELGPKRREGDRQAPEGFYSVGPAQMNPGSSYYLSFDIGYPNAYDRAHGRTGGWLMVHGGCSSRGCYAMTDEQIREIYALARDAFSGGQKAFQVQALPFRMTGLNMMRHASNPNMPFWRMLKQGTDQFDATGVEPKVSVAEKQYVFGPMEYPSDVMVAEKAPSRKAPARTATAKAAPAQPAPRPSGLLAFLQGGN